MLKPAARDAVLKGWAALPSPFTYRFALGFRHDAGGVACYVDGGYAGRLMSGCRLKSVKFVVNPGAAVGDTSFAASPRAAGFRRVMICPLKPHLTEEKLAPWRFTSASVLWGPACGLLEKGASDAELEAYVRDHIGKYPHVGHALVFHESIRKYYDVAPELLGVKPDPALEQAEPPNLPFRTAGEFVLRGVRDEQRGDCLEVELTSKRPLPALASEYAVLRLKQPVVLSGEPTTLGLWVKGNSGWGQVFWEVEDAKGTRRMSCGTTEHGGEVMDYDGSVSIDFDGWAPSCRCRSPASRRSRTATPAASRTAGTSPATRCCCIRSRLPASPSPCRSRPCTSATWSAPTRCSASATWGCMSNGESSAAGAIAPWGIARPRACGGGPRALQTVSACRRTRRGAPRGAPAPRRARMSTSGRHRLIDRLEQAAQEALR
jgi:hypothetical protein